MSNPCKHEKIYQEHQEKKIRSQAAQITAVEAKNKALQEEIVAQIALNLHFQVCKEKVRLQWNYIQELEAKQSESGVNRLRSDLAASESANVLLRVNLGIVKESTIMFEKRFLACWDDGKKCRDELQASKKAAGILEDMLKTKSSVCDQLAESIGNLEKEIDQQRRTIAVLDRNLNIAEKEKEMMG